MTDMTEIKTAELTHLALDWALAGALQVEKVQMLEDKVIYRPTSGGRQVFSHTDPALCMGLIKDHRISLLYKQFSLGWLWVANRTHVGYPLNRFKKQIGATPEQAVARCVVAMKLGDTVEVPSELVG